jgi:hypothetical protein
MLEYAEFLSTGDGRNPAMNIEFLVNVLEGPFDRVDREVQLLGHLAVG